MSSGPRSSCAAASVWSKSRRPGKVILSIAQRILQETENLKHAAQDYSNQDSGSLTIATTHTQARYALPEVIRTFTARYPKVKLSLIQGNPVQICEFTISGQADICIATEAIATFEELAMLPCYHWNRCVVAPPRHPILKQRALTLEAIAKYPIITYDHAFAGRSQINHAFATRGIKPNVVLTAIDSDVIKTYVELGLESAYWPKWHSIRRATEPARARCEPSVRIEHHAHRRPAQCLRARLRLRFHRDVRATPGPQDHR